MPLGQLSASFHSCPPLPTNKLGTCVADSWMDGFVFLGPCWHLQWTLLWGWEFLLLHNPHRFLLPEILRLYFLALDPLLSVSLPSCSSWLSTCKCWNAQFRASALPAPVLQLLLATSPPHPNCLSQPLLPSWVNVSSLTPWFSDFHTVQFSDSCGYLVFQFVVLLVVRVGRGCLPTPPSWPEAIRGIVCTYILLVRW